MTVIRPNSISGITSITAQANDINFFRSDGTLAALQINGINFNNTSGISTLAALNVTGNVSIAGTLTYEDVTNVDSIGIITARSTINAQGDISIVDKIIHTGDTNTSIRFPAADTFAIETGGSERFRVDSSGNTLIYGVLRKDNVSSSLAISGGNAADSSANIVLHGSSGSPANVTQFRTGSIERLRIASDGNVGINQSTPTAKLQVTGGGAYTVADSGRSVEGIDIQSSSGDVNGAFGGAISFGVGNAGRAAIAAVQNNADDDNVGLAFFTHPSNTGAADAEEKVRITSDGNIGIGTIAPENDIHIKTGSATMKLTSTDSATSARLILESEADSYGGLHFGDPSDEDAGRIRYYHGGSDPNHMQFSTAGTERMRISSTGAVTKPNQPCASVYECTGPSGNNVTTTSQNGDPLHFNHIDINQGGMTISNNNARIEVPVDGIYLVTMMISGSVVTVDQNDGIEFNLLRNGTEYPASNSRAEPVFNFGSYKSSSPSGESEYFCTNMLYVNCSSGDFLEIAVSNINNSDGIINRGYFGVMLMA